MLHLLLSVGAHFVKMTYSSHCPNALLLFIYLTTQKMLGCTFSLMKGTFMSVPFISVWWNIQSWVILQGRCRIQVLSSQKFCAVIAWKKCLPRTDWQHTEPSEGIPPGWGAPASAALLTSWNWQLVEIQSGLLKTEAVQHSSINSHVDLDWITNE